MGRLNKDELLRLLHDDDFMVFMQEASYEYQTKKDFFARDMPHDMDPELMWEFVSFLRRMAGRPLVRATVPTNQQPFSALSFWTATPEMIITLNDIVRKTSVNSNLWASLVKLTKRRPILQLLVEEFAAAAYRDGFDIEYETIRALVCKEKEPDDSAERLVFNAVTLFFSLIESTGASSVDAALFARLYARLSSGVGDMLLTPYESPQTLVQSTYPSWSLDETLNHIEEYFKNSYMLGVHPIFGVIMSSDLMWELLPFERFNGFMEVLLRTLFFANIGVPALCFAPLSKQRLDWERGLTSHPAAPWRYGEALIVSSFGVDSTPYLEQIIGFLNQSLGRLERIVLRIDESDKKHKSTIRNDCRLTHRQKEILIEMIDDPTIVMDVGKYEARFEVAASTARTDLTRLVSLNFLFTEFRNKKQLFWARPDIARAIEENSEG